MRSGYAFGCAMWAIGLIAGGIPTLLAIGTISSADVLSLKCIRVASTRANCHLTSSNWMGFVKTEDRNLIGVKGIRRQEFTTSDGDTGYDNFLLTDGGEVLLPNNLNNMAVEEFLASTDKNSLIVRRDVRLPALVFFLLLCPFIVAGFGVIVFGMGLMRR